MIYFWFDLEKNRFFTQYENTQIILNDTQAVTAYMDELTEGSIRVNREMRKIPYASSVWRKMMNYGVRVEDNR